MNANIHAEGRVPDAPVRAGPTPAEARLAPSGRPAPGRSWTRRGPVGAVDDAVLPASGPRWRSPARLPSVVRCAHGHLDCPRLYGDPAKGHQRAPRLDDARLRPRPRRGHAGVD